VCPGAALVRLAQQCRVPPVARRGDLQDLADFWRQLAREGTAVARCTVERLMRRLGLRGVMRGKVVKTTISDTRAPCPLDRVNRQFRAQRPNQLWVSDFTYVSTWQGWLYVAFVIDVFARCASWAGGSAVRCCFRLPAARAARGFWAIRRCSPPHTTTSPTPRHRARWQTCKRRDEATRVFRAPWRPTTAVGFTRLTHGRRPDRVSPRRNRTQAYCPKARAHLSLRIRKR
jgi:hypothetical protein